MANPQVRLKQRPPSYDQYDPGETDHNDGEAPDTFDEDRLNQRLNLPLTTDPPIGWHAIWIVSGFSVAAISIVAALMYFAGFIISVIAVVAALAAILNGTLDDELY